MDRKEPTFEELAEAVSKYTIRSRIKDWVVNFTENQGRVLDGLDVMAVFDTFPKIPALIVGTGPSLDRNIGLVPQIRDKMVVLACDSALRPLLRVGVKPDLVVTADSKERVGVFFDGVDTSELIWACDVFTSPKVVSVWKGTVLWYQVAPTDRMPFAYAVKELTGGITGLGAGGCVSSIAWSIAYGGMKCDPIVMIGQDMGWYTEKHHAAHSDGEGFPISPDLVRDNWGRLFKTTPALKVYCQWFEEMAQEWPGIFINCTEGGMLREHWLSMKLVDFANRYLADREPIDPPVINVLRERVEGARGEKSQGGCSGPKGVEGPKGQEPQDS